MMVKQARTEGAVNEYQSAVLVDEQHAFGPQVHWPCNQFFEMFLCCYDSRLGTHQLVVQAQLLQEKGCAHLNTKPWIKPTNLPH
jgi:hypothetical protein